ncbi:MAG: hypothetical protein CMQ39_00185 [Gammaproteobacteria bacterium]|nr:hypothetical protein [Gammaproteobacteria bacterium]
MSKKSERYPLSDLKVLDFSRVLAGPFAGRMLSDLGADVVKIEPPEGDVTRFWGKEVANIRGYYHQQNIGKRNVCLNLRKPEAVSLVKRLVEATDIVIENYRPDVMDRLGLGYETLRKTNPRIIMLSISGFGRNGPESRKPAYAPVVHAEVGLIHRKWKRDGGSLSDLPTSLADTNAALHGLVGTLAAVHMRERTGVGQHLDIAMIDATAATDDQLQYDLESSHHTAPLPNEVWGVGFGHVMIATDFRLFFRLLVEHFNLEDPTHPDMELNQKVALRRAAVGNFLREIKTKEDFEAVMEKLNIAWGEVIDPANLFNQKTIKHRKSVIKTDNRQGGLRPTTQSPYRFSDALSGTDSKTSYRGEDYESVLCDWLDIGESELADLRKKEVILFSLEWKAGEN